ncbi:hypothetical protein ACQPZF_14880 [Actinosynnema sp. CS-041913]|uniref:hypothetical protein n=1 Tax=Actinosynnema sp. CS-041913 TaxID=3239917 RepID=UPI003D8E4B50
MFDARWTEVPARPGETPWATRRVERTVLGVVHNVTSATRLFDVLTPLARDPRVQVVFSCTESSAFTPGTAEFLTAQGVLAIPWEQAVSAGFDLAVATSHGGTLDRLAAPLIVLPHGMGYNKYSPGNRKSEIGNRKSVFGLSAEWLLSGGEVVPASIVLSHDEQLDRLARSCPPAVPRAVVAGDPCFDRMLAGLPLRASYRAALGVLPHQRLVVISSTWGAESLFGKLPDLTRRVRAALPLDDYQVAVALHPNTWHGHSDWQVRRWLDDCEGVLALPPAEGWRAALVAADVVVGDHGSVTYYGAALGRPVLLATAAEHEVDPESAVGKLLAAAPRLTREPLRAQLDRVHRDGLPPEAVAAAALATSVPGESFALLRKEFHRLLDLPEPPVDPEVRTVPPAEVRPIPVTHHWARVDGERVTRFAAHVGRPPPGCHLVVSTDTPDANRLQAAEIVLHHRPGNAEAWLTETLDALPGLVVAAMPTAPGRWLIGTRDGHRVEADGPHRASVVYARLAKS